MNEHYRARALPCPLCAGMLEERATEAAAVDVCTDCHGVWIDWFDGDIATIAGQVAPARPRRASSTAAPAPRAKGCPRCSRALEAEPFRESGPEVLRCPDCAGVFIPRDALAAVVALGPPEDPPSAGPSVWSRLADTLRRLVSE